MLRHPSARDVDKALKIASSTETRGEYELAQSIKITSTITRIKELDQEYNELNNIDELIKPYTASSEYDAQRFAQQKQLQESHKKIITEIENTELPELSQESEEETPFYKQLQDKYSTMAQEMTLEKIKEKIEQWNEEPIIKAIENLHEPLDDILKVDKPNDLDLSPDKPSIIDFSSLEEAAEKKR